MNYQKLALTCGGQDGAIFGDTLFRFTAKGIGRAWSVKALLSAGAEKAVPPAEFTVSGIEAVLPHFNAVFFGAEPYAPKDEFPLLYANVYNNYSKEEDRRIGQLVAYRITRTEDSFAATPVQLIRIGFAHDTDLWISYGEKEEKADARPYGNFLCDPEKKLLYAFVMRDKEQICRYFTLPLPSPTEGEVNAETGLREVVIAKEAILGFFDTPYHRYVQGACFHDGKIYSTEGFGENERSRSAIRIIDVDKKEQVAYYDLVDAGLPVEPEWIEFYGEHCFYSDATGILYQMEF